MNTNRRTTQHFGSGYGWGWILAHDDCLQPEVVPFPSQFCSFSQEMRTKVKWEWGGKFQPIDWRRSGLEWKAMIHTKWWRGVACPGQRPLGKINTQTRRYLRTLARKLCKVYRCVHRKYSHTQTYVTAALRRTLRKSDRNFPKCLCSTRSYARSIWQKQKRTNLER
jgi:hypothetical protein